MISESDIAEWVLAEASISTDAATPLDDHQGIIELFADDMVVRVRTGSPIGELRGELRDAGLDLDLPTGETAAFVCPDHWTLLQALDRNLPLLGERVPLSWKDLVLGCTFILADGQVAQSGSRVTKSVAGYDVHKFLVGSLGTLGLISSAYLRVVSFNRPESWAAATAVTGKTPSEFFWVGHIYEGIFDNEENTKQFFASQVSHSTFWSNQPIPAAHDCRDSFGLPYHPAAHPDLVQRTKVRFDPAHKLNMSRFDRILKGACVEAGHH